MRCKVSLPKDLGRGTTIVVDERANLSCTSLYVILSGVKRSRTRRAMRSIGISIIYIVSIISVLQTAAEIPPPLCYGAASQFDCGLRPSLRMTRRM